MTRDDLPGWPEGQRFAAILADPPWAFKVWAKDTGHGRSAESHYATQGLDWIKSLPVADLAAPDCALFLWACMPQLPEALDVIAAWGFRFKTCAFTWAKTTRASTPTWAPRWHIGLGYWTRANAELCLLATRGHPKRLRADVRQLIVAPVREHSRKPEESRERIEQLVVGPYLELFARQARPGWVAWGNQTDRFAGEE